MDREQILKEYQWSDGICFRHPAKGDVPTTSVSTIHPRVGGTEDVRACRDCVIEMEQARPAAASRSGTPCEPGRGGQQGT